MGFSIVVITIVNQLFNLRNALMTTSLHIRRIGVDEKHGADQVAIKRPVEIRHRFGNAAVSCKRNITGQRVEPWIVRKTGARRLEELQERIALLEAIVAITMRASSDEQVEVARDQATVQYPLVCGGPFP